MVFTTLYPSLCWPNTYFFAIKTTADLACKNLLAIEHTDSMCALEIEVFHKSILQRRLRELFWKDYDMLS